MSSQRDMNFMRHPLWEEQYSGAQIFFSDSTISLIQKKVAQLTKGVDKLNRTIIVPKERIVETMDGVYQGFTPAVTDIYSRYIVPNMQQNNMLQSLIDQTIEVIVSHIRNELGVEQQNKTLSAWVQVYGDFNKEGLRQHAPLKILENKPMSMMFNMNY